MGKPWKATAISGGVAMTSFIAYTQTPQPISWYHTLFFVFSLIALAVCIIAVLVCIKLFTKLHLNPISFLDDVRCIYWTKEKQVRVEWSFCDFSKSTVFVFNCVACFGEQIVNMDGERKLKVLGDPNAECINGSRIFVEQFKQDIEVENPNNCQLKLSVKPHGRFWATQKKTEAVVTQLVNH